jgi:hypothetical protein
MSETLYPVHTRDAARLLGLSTEELLAHLAVGRIKEPGKDANGRGTWTRDDVCRARAALFALKRRPSLRERLGLRGADHAQ